MKFTKKVIVVLVAVSCLLCFGVWAPNEKADEMRYADAELIMAQSDETIYYSKKEISEQKLTDGGIPTYEQLSDLQNACGAVAGTVIAGYYDKYFPDMIPGWQSYYAASGKYKMQDKTYVPAIMRELYSLMRTNIDDIGVSENDFKNGLKTYINRNGYQINYQSILSGQYIDYETFKKTIDSNKVVVLFANVGEIYKLVPGVEYDEVNAAYITQPHIMVAYGYRQIKYYNSNGLFRTDIYLDVLTAKSGMIKALYKINRQLDAAYIININ